MPIRPVLVLSFLSFARAFLEGCIPQFHHSRHPHVCALDEGVGSLIVFATNKGELKLGAITGEEDAKKKKKRWIAVDVNGNACLVPSRDVKHVVPGGHTSGVAALSAHEREAARAVDEEALAIPDVWEMLLEDTGTLAVPITAICELLFGETSSISCYATYTLLSSQQGRVYFKSLKDGTQYSPRSEIEKEVTSVSPAPYCSDD
ncbi:MAG: hypothetical protein SGPRY_004209 [Prymnesium sp.]